MAIPAPLQAVAALAAFVCTRSAETSDTLTPSWNPRDGEIIRASEQVTASARQLATVLVGATAPFAPTSYSRSRLLRQMHAGGLLSDQDVRRTEAVLDAHYGGADAFGAPC